MTGKKGCGRVGVWTVLAVLAMLTPAPAPAQSPTGAAFIQITPSPRSYALGMSKGVTALGAQAIGANPANMGLMRHGYELFSSFATLPGGAQYQHLAGAAAAPRAWPLEAVGLSVSRVHVPGLAAADGQGTRSGASFGAGDLSASLSASAKLGRDWRLGATAKALQSQIGEYRSNLALASDFGLTYTFSGGRKPVTLGLSVTNLGPGMRFLDQTDPLPTAVNLGAALPLGPALAVAEVNRLVHERRTELGTGVELGLGAVSLRAGYLAQNEASRNLALADQGGIEGMINGLSFGVGLGAGSVKFEYAVSQLAVEYGATHRAALTLHWGAKSAPTQAQPWKHRDRSDWLIRPLPLQVD